MRLGLRLPWISEAMPTPFTGKLLRLSSTGEIPYKKLSNFRTDTTGTPSTIVWRGSPNVNIMGTKRRRSRRVTPNLTSNSGFRANATDRSTCARTAALIRDLERPRSQCLQSTAKRKVSFQARRSISLRPDRVLKTRCLTTSKPLSSKARTAKCSNSCHAKKRETFCGSRPA